MHVLNVNSYLDLKTGGGTAERTFQMSRFLAREGVQCTVLTLDIGLDDIRISMLKPAVVVALPCLWKRFFLPRVEWKTIRKLVEEADIVHLMGHWGLLNAFVYLAICLAGKPYVVCPAGALPLFGRSAWLKRLYNFVIGNSIIRNASAWIAVTKGEFPHFQAYGIGTSQIVVIPNGVSNVDFQKKDTNEFLHRYGLPNVPIILFVGRLNKIKGPDLLLEAFIISKNQIPDYHLVFAGPDDGMLSTLEYVVSQERIADRVHFLGHINGDDKSAAYSVARLLVVPSRQEAMSIVALEAGICGTPVLVTDQCGFSEIRTVDERLEVSTSATGIADGLIQLLTKSGALESISPVWHHYVEQRFVWSAIISKYIDLYSDITRRQ